MFSCSEGDVGELIRPYKIAAECSCKFYLCSDPHFSSDFECAKSKFEKIISMLKLEEEQKFDFNLH